MKNTDTFLKADPSLKPHPPGLAYQAAPPTEVCKFLNLVFSGLSVDYLFKWNACNLIGVLHSA